VGDWAGGWRADTRCADRRGMGRGQVGRKFSASLSCSPRRARGRGYRTTVGVHSKFETKSTSRTERPHRVSGENSTIMHVIRSRISIHRSIGQALGDPRCTSSLSGIQAPGTRGSEDPGESRHPIRGIREIPSGPPSGGRGRGRRKSARGDSGSRGLGGRRIRGHPCDDSRTPALEDPRGSGGARARAHFRPGVPGGPWGALFACCLKSRCFIFNNGIAVIVSSS
jgi:hypothetical protein